MFILIYVYSICDNIRIRHINIVGLVSYIVYIYIFIYLIYHSYYKCFTFLYHIYIYIYLNIYHAQFITYHLSCKMNKQYIYIYIFIFQTRICVYNSIIRSTGLKLSFQMQGSFGKNPSKTPRSTSMPPPSNRTDSTSTPQA